MLDPRCSVIEVGDADNRHFVRSEDLSIADDLPTINYWNEQRVIRENGNFRNNNKIPFWQHRVHNRPYDRSNEGFIFKDAKRGSLVGYNSVRNNINRWDDVYKNWACDNM